MEAYEVDNMQNIQVEVEVNIDKFISSINACDVNKMADSIEKIKGNVQAIEDSNRVEVLTGGRKTRKYKKKSSQRRQSYKKRRLQKGQGKLSKYVMILLIICLLMGTVNAVRIPVEHFADMLQIIYNLQISNCDGICFANAMAMAGMRKQIGEEEGQPVFENAAVTYKRNVMAYHIVRSLDEQDILAGLIKLYKYTYPVISKSSIEQFKDSLKWQIKLLNTRAYYSSINDIMYKTYNITEEEFKDKSDAEKYSMKEIAKNIRNGYVFSYLLSIQLYTNYFYTCYFSHAVTIYSNNNSIFYIYDSDYNDSIILGTDKTQSTSNLISITLEEYINLMIGRHINLSKIDINYLVFEIRLYDTQWNDKNVDYNVKHLPTIKDIEDVQTDGGLTRVYVRRINGNENTVLDIGSNEYNTLRDKIVNGVYNNHIDLDVSYLRNVKNHSLFPLSQRTKTILSQGTMYILILIMTIKLIESLEEMKYGYR